MDAQAGAELLICDVCFVQCDGLLIVSIGDSIPNSLLPVVGKKTV